jgi:NAD(P)-dependent dehydrogenase (short-subunit alcohol dehydrogenase family)
MTRCLAIEGQKYGIRAFILAPVALTRMTDDLALFKDEKFKTQMNPSLISPLVTYLASDLSKELTGKTFFVGGGRIAEMRVVTHTGLEKKEEGGLWTPQEVADKMKAGEILLPD